MPASVSESSRELPETLIAHLRAWVGAWPPAAPPLVVGNPRSDEPRWDGQIRPVLGVVDNRGRVVVGVPPAKAESAANPPFADLADLERDLPARLGEPDHQMFRGVFRWSDAPPSVEELPDAGVWLSHDDPRVPAWLRPFGGEALVALEDDVYVAGVGIKRHDRWGHEIAVVTDKRAQGRGLARHLVAQAARKIVADGAVATYLHGADNIASAKVAEAAGFPDHGWSVLGMWRVGDNP